MKLAEDHQQWHCSRGHIWLPISGS